VIVTGLSPDPLDTAALVARIRRADCGGLVTFEGTTRSPSDGKVVTALSYEAYESRASAQLEQLAHGAIERFGVKGVVAMHRVGDVPIGEPSVVVACAAAHRAEAFEAARWLIDTLKQEVAVWKRELFEDGSASWVGMDGTNV
jgi:molybdopterin synthase catalytic subunit